MGVADSGNFDHICFVVEDLEKSARRLTESLSIKPWSVWTIEPDSAILHGSPARMKFLLAVAPVGGSRFELIQPLSGPSVYSEHLVAKGEGYHHSCLSYQTHDAMRRAKAELLSQGRKLIQGGTLGDQVEFCYFQIEENGDILELLYLAEMPPAELTIE